MLLPSVTVLTPGNWWAWDNSNVDLTLIRGAL